MKDSFTKQVELLLRILPEVSGEKNFALHGGTAINLFELNMPRLSVDIDLTFTSIGEREKDMALIRMLLDELKTRIQKRIPDVIFSDAVVAAENLKINCATKDATVKIEVNQINRGLISPIRLMQLCDKAQVTFDSFCEMPVVSFEQLWGGKIIAALDRQHPRDMFDVNNFFNVNNFTAEIKRGFIFFLLCSKRPAHELLTPQLLNHKTLFENQFKGMTYAVFTYDEFEEVRLRLIKTIHSNLADDDKRFIVSFAKGDPLWNDTNFSEYPAIKWKLKNINIFKKTNPGKFQQQISLLEDCLSSKPGML